MFSLQFCLPTTNRTHFFSPQPRPPSPNSLYILRTSSHLPHPLCAVAQNVIVEEDDVVSERVAVADAGARPAVGETLPAGLRGEAMPKHVAVIMDGNRRWARMKGLSVGSGYKAGIRSLRVLVELCCRWGIRVLSVFAFSSDNWLRPKVEVDFLMSLFEQGIRDELDNFVREGVQISIIGDSSKLPESLQQLITNARESTKHNSRLQLIVAVSYSGQYDIVQACQSIALKVKDGLIEPEDVNEFLIEQELETNCTKFPYPDLLIRTSGELRVSNFLLWQLAYTELFFSQSHWPDFGEAELLEALQSFQQRQRRYGRQVL
ncbi:cis-prenyltransferase 4, chloroplastic-like [Cornus florida]|uniref:cis-prenyltransferase 4, chloroplastic-like n=1 Tax=Cornus florida TaxID=4283 RepID=UPI002896963C|nr:cis-prenyltransferase 4, chloroplastic-like [Cornus florida]